jgi:hypothetical protein
MLTEPSGLRGTFGVFTDGHCADSDRDHAAIMATTTDMNALIRPPGTGTVNPNMALL